MNKQQMYEGRVFYKPPNLGAIWFILDFTIFFCEQPSFSYWNRINAIAKKKIHEEHKDTFRTYLALAFWMSFPSRVIHQLKTTSWKVKW